MHGPLWQGGSALDSRSTPEITPRLCPDTFLFSESNGRFVVTTSVDQAATFESFFTDLPCQRIGHVTSEPELAVSYRNQTEISVTIDQLCHSFKKGLADA